jgi:hypothetical protein
MVMLMVMAAAIGDCWGKLGDLPFPIVLRVAMGQWPVPLWRQLNRHGWSNRIVFCLSVGCAREQNPYRQNIFRDL